MQAVRTQRLSISYQDRGAGDPVLLVHGWPDSSRGWSSVADGLTRDGWRVVVPDLRGSGSTRFLDERHVRDGSAAALVRDALDVADHLGLDQFRVVAMTGALGPHTASRRTRRSGSRPSSRWPWGISRTVRS